MSLFDFINQTASAISGVEIFKQNDPYKQLRAMGYSEKLLQLIEMSLVDGILTDEERSVLLNQAKKEGVEKEELNMVLNNLLSQTTNNVSAYEKKKNSSPQTKCPACGATLIDNKTNYCPECGNKLFDIVEGLQVRISEIKNNAKQQRGKGIFTAIGGLLDEYSDDVECQIVAAIASYPLPCTKEDVRSFLAFSVIKGRKEEYGEDFGDDKEQEAFYRKSEEIIKRSRIKYASDSGFLKELDEKAIELGMEKKKRKSLFSR